MIVYSGNNISWKKQQTNPKFLTTLTNLFKWSTDFTAQRKPISFSVFSRSSIPISKHLLAPIINKKHVVFGMFNFLDCFIMQV